MQAANPAERRKLSDYGDEELEQSQVVGILGLQGADQDFKGRKLAEILEPRIFQKERPAGESVAHATLQPGKGRFALPE